jgi:hypothetical protein
MMNPLGRVRREPADQAYPAQRQEDLDFWRFACKGILSVLLALFAAIVLARYSGSVVSSISQLFTGSWRDIVCERDCSGVDHDGSLNLNRLNNATVSKINVNIPRITAVPAPRDWLDPTKEWRPADLDASFNKIVREHMIAPETSDAVKFDFRRLLGEQRDRDSKDLVLHAPTKLAESLNSLYNFVGSKLNILRIQNYTNSFNMNYTNALESAERCKRSITDKEREILNLLNDFSAKLQERETKVSRLNQLKIDIRELEALIESERSKAIPKNPRIAELERIIEDLRIKIRDSDNDQ